MSSIITYYNEPLAACNQSGLTTSGDAVSYAIQIGPLVTGTARIPGTTTATGLCSFDLALPVGEVVNWTDTSGVMGVVSVEYSGGSFSPAGQVHSVVGSNGMRIRFNSTATTAFTAICTFQYRAE